VSGWNWYEELLWAEEPCLELGPEVYPGSLVYGVE
jgi:hypothetical protein